MTGWKAHTQAASVFGLVLASMPPAALTEQSGDDAPPKSFFEFLAEWEDENGEWQDPMAYEGPHWQVLDQSAENTDE